MRIQLKYLFHYSYSFSMNYTLYNSSPYFGVFSFSLRRYPIPHRSRCNFDIEIKAWNKTPIDLGFGLEENNLTSHSLDYFLQEFIDGK